MNFPRAYFSLLTIGDAFVAIGGVTNDGYTAEVEVYFNFTKAWSRQDSDLSLDTARSSFATLLLPSTPSEYAGRSLFFFFFFSFSYIIGYFIFSSEGALYVILPYDYTAAAATF